MEKLKKILKNKKVASLALAVVCAASLFVGTFAWFTGTISRQGIDVNSGKLIVTSNAYTYNPVPTTDDPILRKSSTTPAGQGASVIASIEEKKNDNIYFIVERSAESIDVDYLITWTLENGTVVALTPSEQEEETRYIGGFWYKFSKINTYVEGASYRDHSTSKVTYTYNENLLASFIQDNPNHPIIIGDPTGSHSLADLSKDPIRGDLHETAHTDFYIMNYGYGSEISELTNRTLQLRMNVDYAQVGGLPGEQREGSTIYVSTLTQFKSAVLTYIPGQTIRVTGNIDYDRDLVFQAPVHLEIDSATLTIAGNLIFKYPYSDMSSLDTSANGKLFVISKNGYGGNLEVNVPQGKFVFIGKGGAGNPADVYVQSNVILCASYDDDKGVVIEKMNFYTTTSTGAATTERKAVYYKNNTRIEIFSNTIVASVEPYPSVSEGETAPEYIKILNQGTIQRLNFWSLNYISTYITKPQIYVRNYGIIGTNDNDTIDLPYWATKFGHDDITETYYGNCYIRKELTSNDFHVLCQAHAGFDNPFTDADIDQDELTIYVVEHGSPTNVTIHYRDHNNTTYTLKDILTEHYHTTAIDSYLAAYTDVEIICAPNNKISTTDQNIILKMTNVVNLDLEDAYYVNNSISKQYAFESCTKLENLILPKTIEYLGDGLLKNTKIREITIPESVSSVHSWFFWTNRDINSAEYKFYKDRVTFFHILNKSVAYSISITNTTDYNNYAPVFLVDSSMLALYRNKYAKFGICEDGIVAPNYNFVYSYNEDTTYYNLHTYIGDIDTSYFEIGTFDLDGSNSVTISNICDYAFYRYGVVLSTKYGTIRLGDHVSYIGSYAFQSFKASTFEFNNANTIYDYAFYTSQIDLLDFENANYIGKYAFYKGTYDTILLGNVQKVDIQAFYTSVIDTLDCGTCKEICSQAFYSCHIKTLQNCNSIEILHYQCFYANDFVTLSMPNLVECNRDGNSWAYIFFNCFYLEYAYCPNFRYNWAEFEYCTRLHTVYLGLPKEWGSQFYECRNVVYLYLCGDENTPIEQKDYINSGTMKECYKVNNTTGNVNFNLRVIVNENVYNSHQSFFTDTSGIQNRSCILYEDNPINYDRFCGEVYFKDDEVLPIHEYHFNLYVDQDDGQTKAELTAFTYPKIEVEGDYTTPGSIEYKGVTYPVGKLGLCFDGTTMVIEGNLIINPATTQINSAYCTYISKTIGGDVIGTNIKYVGDYFMYRASALGDYSFPVLKECGKYAFSGINSTYMFKGNDFYLPILDVIGDYSFTNIQANFLSFPAVTALPNGFWQSGVTNSSHIGTLRFDNLETIGANKTFMYGTSCGLRPTSCYTYIDNFYANKITTLSYLAFYYIEFNNFHMDGLVQIGGSTNIFHACKWNKLVLPSFTTFVGTNWCFGYVTATDGIYFPNLVNYTNTHVLIGSSSVSLIYMPNVTHTYSDTMYNGDVYYAPKSTDKIINTGSWDDNCTFRAIYTAACNNTVDDACVRDKIKYLYLCGDGLITSMSLKRDRGDNTLMVFVKDKNYAKVSTCMPRDRGYIVINTGDIDPADLFYNASLTGIVYRNYNFPDYQYIVNGNNAYAVGCLMNEINDNVLSIGGTVTCKNIIDGTTNQYQLIGLGNSLYENTAITSNKVVIGSGIQKIGQNCFFNYFNNKSFTSVEINGYGNIEAGAFKNNLLSTVVLGENIVQIDDSAFEGISSNALVTIKNKDNMIPDGTGFGSSLCPNIMVTVPGQVYSQYRALGLWHNIPTTNISCFDYIYNDTTQGVKFYYNLNSDDSINIVFAESTTSTPSLIVPTSIDTGSGVKTVKSIETGIMSGVQNIASITLPSTLERFSYSRAGEPQSLQDYSIDSGNLYFTTIDGILYNKDISTIISYPKGKADSLHAFSTPSTVTNIPAYSFANNTDLQTITIEGNSRISANAFDGCTSLSSIIINGNVTVDSYAFANLNISSITFNGTADINGYAFNNCAYLTSVIFNDVTNIHSYAFYDLRTDIVIEFTSSTASVFDGYNIFGSNYGYVIKVPSANIQDYINNIYYDHTIVNHIQGVIAA